MVRLALLPIIVSALTGLVAGQGNNTEPLRDNGLTNVVQWDSHSYVINGERLFLFSGEFHYWRLPVPELWRDLLEKMKAAGFNAFSIYAHWGYHEPAPGVLDFESGARNFTSIMTLAKDLGIYLLIRPGPYVNAETNAGGFPLWLTTGEYGKLRDDDPRYTAAWTPFWSEISHLIEPHLVTNGGNVAMFQIENELGGQWLNDDARTLNFPVANYMQLLQDGARDAGIDTVVFHNAPNQRTFSWSEDFEPGALGNVDTVGTDSYPSCWSCNLSECTRFNGNYRPYLTVDYVPYFEKQAPNQPRFLPEFQGESGVPIAGSYNPWGGPEGGCPTDIGPDFANLFYRDLVGQQSTSISLYMMYGGTNWGWLACPVVATSYDYSSPISENRHIGDKYSETKLLPLFLRVAQDLTKTERVESSTRRSTNPAVLVNVLVNVDNDAGFYVVRHNDSPSGTRETFQLDVDTSAGQLRIPQHGGQITLNGHQAKIIPTDFTFGSKSLLYSTAEVLSFAVFGDTEVLVLWLPEGETGEITIKESSSIEQTGDAQLGQFKVTKGENDVTVTYTQEAGLFTAVLEDGSTIILADRKAAYRFWVPTLTNSVHVPTNETVFVHGPYLVRHAAWDQATRTLELEGDLDTATELTVFAPASLCTLKWNGEKVKIDSRDGNKFTASLEGPQAFELPALSSWRYTDSLPEISPEYKPTDTVWVVANRTNTTNSVIPDLKNPVLYVDEYDIHFGSHIFRATFPTAEEAQTGVHLNLTGGLAFGYSAWLNNDYIGSYLGLSYEGAWGQDFSFDNATLSTDGDNVLTILMDNSGHDLREAALAPRGITNATLLGPDSDAYAFSGWKIAGTAGGGRGFVDPVRGLMNEGGLYAERIGAHLPRFDDKDWTAHPANATTLDNPAAGVRAYRTTVNLDVPSHLDVSISFKLTAPGYKGLAPSKEGYSNQVRALLFVNGYQFGRFNPYIGNQVSFPVPPGILDYHGENTIAVTVWSQSADGGEVKVEWELDYVHTTSFDLGFDSEYLRPGWTEDRLQYV